MGDEDGEARLRQGGRFEINLPRDVYLGGDTLRVSVPDPELPDKQAIVTVVEMTNKPKGLHLNCEQCQVRCDHIAAVLGMVLDEKLTLGLSAPPDPSEPIETPDRRRTSAARSPIARSVLPTEKMTLRSLDPNRPWTDYTITSRQSGKTYRVSLRGFEPGQSYCSCPDFRTNHLGTCKHVLHAQAKIKKRFPQKKLDSPIADAIFRCDWTMASNSDCGSTCLIDWIKRRTRSSARFVIERSMTWTGCSSACGNSSEPGTRSTSIRTPRSSSSSGCCRRRLAAGCRRNPQRPDKPSAAEGAAERRVAALPAGRHRLCRRGRPRCFGRRHGTGKDDSRHWRRGIARSTGRHPPRAGRLPGIAEEPVAQRDQPLLWANSQLVIGSREERVEQYESDTFFTICNYEQVLRDHRNHRADGLGPDHSGRRPADQELGIEDIQADYESQVAFRLGAVRHATGESAGRALHGCSASSTTGGWVRRIASFTATASSMIGAESRAIANLDELRETLKPILLRRTRDERDAGIARTDAPKSFASGPPKNS